MRRRPDVSRRHELTEFLTWLLGKHSQAESDPAGTGRALRRRTAWCWNITPTVGPVETIYHAVIVDGIWIGDWCLLIAISDTGHVLAWQWCGRETTAAWSALLAQIPAPGVIVSDGGSGLPSALRQHWPETKHQRCLFHVQMNVTRHLTRNPRTAAGKALNALVGQLSGIHDEDAAIAWQISLDQWWRVYGHLTKERTLFRNGQWGYTHDRLRKAWHLIRGVVRAGTLFAYITYGNPRTTSALEGGINNGIRHVLRHHRGMTIPHMRRAAEWFLTTREIPLATAAATFAHQTTSTPTTPDNDHASEPDPISLYDTGLTADEGLWTRSGWAGRN